MVGGRRPRRPAELEDLRRTAPEAVVASGTHLYVTRAHEPWFPIVNDAAGITESQLIADSEDASFGWALLTPEVRRLTVAGGLAGWRLDGHELHLARSADPTLPVDATVTRAQHLVALARALPADVLARHQAAPGVP